ncbi:hypothetical protein FGO68_gene8463 [Halteria grandinella]|uniref:Uncharacterized protein n=1 Tax=Halteria grandinella TaxID=5974 RepID=A0A8J8T8K9_HALGN|nr:hypothetical protein FGO68_gene8463 [Halteria grandinella]
MQLNPQQVQHPYGPYGGANQMQRIPQDFQNPQGIQANHAMLSQVINVQELLGQPEQMKQVDQNIQAQKELLQKYPLLVKNDTFMEHIAKNPSLSLSLLNNDAAIQHYLAPLNPPVIVQQQPVIGLDPEKERLLKQLEDLKAQTSKQEKLMREQDEKWALKEKKRLKKKIKMLEEEKQENEDKRCKVEADKRKSEEMDRKRQEEATDQKLQEEARVKKVQEEAMEKRKQEDEQKRLDDMAKLDASVRRKVAEFEQTQRNQIIEMQKRREKDEQERKEQQRRDDMVAQLKSQFKDKINIDQIRSQLSSCGWNKDTAWKAIDALIPKNCNLSKEQEQVT